MHIFLSPRLQRIADYVRPGERVIDVGTDHAYIPIWLLTTGRFSTVTATDIRPGPLGNAARDAEKYGVADRIDLRLCDGLTGCSADIADTVIIAGMGGETIIDILEKTPWVREKRLILQPQSKQQMLRAWLSQHGFAIADASLVYDTGRIYLVWLVEAGSMAGSVAIDPILVEKRDPLLKSYLESLVKVYMKQIRGMECAANADQRQLSELRKNLDEILATHKEVVQWPK